GPERVPKVLREILHDGDPARVAALFFHERHRTERAHGGSARVCRLHAGGGVLVNLFLQMETNLGAQLGVCVDTAEHRSQTHSGAIDPARHCGLSFINCAWAPHFSIASGPTPDACRCAHSGAAAADGSHALALSAAAPVTSRRRLSRRSANARRRTSP